MPDTTQPHAGVAFPPPLVYVAGILIGWLLHVWSPLPITDGASAARVVVGAIMFLVYLGFFLTAYRSFRRAHTTLIPNRPATAFVTEGPYRLTRNPMYVSLVALYIAVMSWLNSWWPLVLLPLVLLVIDRAVIAREERYLSEAFPEEYAAYRSRVRRWL